MRGNQSSLRARLAEAKCNNGKTSRGVVARTPRLTRGSHVWRVRWDRHLPRPLTARQVCVLRPSELW
jgi:hypothetical protein